MRPDLSTTSNIGTTGTTGKTRKTVNTRAARRARPLNPHQSEMLLRYARGLEQVFFQLGKSAGRSRALWKRGYLLVVEEQGKRLRYDLTDAGRDAAARLITLARIEQTERTEQDPSGEEAPYAAMA